MLVPLNARLDALNSMIDESESEVCAALDEAEEDTL
jgi:hypothetical protein